VTVRTHFSLAEASFIRAAYELQSVTLAGLPDEVDGIGSNYQVTPDFLIWVWVDRPGVTDTIDVSIRIDGQVVVNGPHPLAWFGVNVPPPKAGKPYGNLDGPIPGQGDDDAAVP